jgi:hypothetical protein
VLELWQVTREWSLDELRAIMDMLDIHSVDDSLQ